MNNHEKLIKKCLKLAIKAKNQTWPNPLVGAVIVKNGEIIGEGYHKKYGEHHAEINALNNATINPENSTLYVNLEPCSHYGKTPPCVDAIIKSKIKNVYIGMLDPNPKVSGNGVKKLLSAGINVYHGILEDECKEINLPFVKFITKKESFFTLKLASTLDGKIAESNGYSKWITSNKSREIVHYQRSFCNGIMIGSNTLKNDNPQLNIRFKEKIINEPNKIIVSQKLNFNPNKFDIFNKLPEKIFIITSIKNRNSKKISQFPNNCNFIFFNEKNNLLDLSKLPKVLYDKKLYNIYIEGGSKLASSLIKLNLIDKFYFFISNKILGNGVSMFENLNFSLKNPFQIKIQKVIKIEEEILITAFPKDKTN